MFAQSNVREGMVVRSLDGEKLGKVFAVGEGQFLVEKGLFFPKDYSCLYTDITDIRDGEVFLSRGREQLQDLSLSTPRDTGLVTDAPLPMTAAAPVETATHRDLSASAGLDLDRERDISIPLAHEELSVTKREVEAGEVRITKEVIEEEQVIRVPVKRERARIERRPVDPNRPAMNASFENEEIVVPLHTEQVSVTKHAVVDEEVVIHRDEVEDERRVAESVRHEHVDIRSDGNTETSRSLNAQDALKDRR